MNKVKECPICEDYMIPQYLMNLIIIVGKEWICPSCGHQEEYENE